MAFLFDAAFTDITSGTTTGGPPWLSAQYKMTLVTSAFPASAGLLYCSAFSGYELSSFSFNAGYGGLMRRMLSNAFQSYNATSHQLELGADPIVWSGLSAGSVGAFILLRESGSDAVSPMIAYYPAVFIVTNGGTFTVSAPASGFLVVSAA